MEWKREVVGFAVEKKWWKRKRKILKKKKKKRGNKEIPDGSGICRG